MMGEKKHGPKAAPENQLHYTAAEDGRQARILHLLEDGRKTKLELISQTGYAERDVRKAIEDLRRNGVRILSSSHESGYWISDDASEFEAFKREMLSRASRITTTIEAMEGTDV